MKTSFYFFGDSICFGQYVSHHLTWVSEVSSHIARIGEEYGAEIVTQVLAVNGETTHQALDRLNHAVLAHDPTFVWVQFGLNDANYWKSDLGAPRVSVDRFAANIDEIVNKILRTTKAIVLLANNHPVTRELEGNEEGQYSRNVEMYNDVLRSKYAVEKSDRLQFVDIEHEIRGSELNASDILLADGVHLSRVGHDLYSQLAIRRIVPTIRLRLETRGIVGQ